MHSIGQRRPPLCAGRGLMGGRGTSWSGQNNRRLSWGSYASGRFTLGVSSGAANEGSGQQPISDSLNPPAAPFPAFPSGILPPQVDPPAVAAAPLVSAEIGSLAGAADLSTGGVSGPSIASESAAVDSQAVV